MAQASLHPFQVPPSTPRIEVDIFGILMQGFQTCAFPSLFYYFCYILKVPRCYESTKTACTHADHAQIVPTQHVFFPCLVNFTGHQTKMSASVASTALYMTDTEKMPGSKTGLRCNHVFFPPDSDPSRARG